MFGDDNNINSFQQLFKETKKYVELNIEYGKLALVEKLTVLLSTLIFILITIILSMVALFYFSFTIAYVLSDLVGGLTASFAIITACLLLIIGMLYVFRERLIVQPLVQFIAKLLLEDKEDLPDTPTETTNQA